MKEFAFDNKFKNIMIFSIVFFFFLVALSLVLPFLPEEKTRPNVIIISALGTLFFGFLAVSSWITLKKLPFMSVATDEDGIWDKYKGKKNGLIPWPRISKIKERSFLQCLDLLDSNNKKLIRVEYQLNNFEILRNIINESVSLSLNEFNRRRFYKSYFYHLLNIVFIFGCLILGLYIGTTGDSLFGYLGMGVIFVLGFYEYATTVTGVYVTSNSLKMSYPITKREIIFSDIIDIKFSDRFNRGKRFPEIWIVSKNSRKPFKLKKLGVDENVLFAVLRNAVSL